MTPREYLSEEFKDEVILSNPENEEYNLISVVTCMKLMELYHKFEVNRIVTEIKANE